MKKNDDLELLEEAEPLAESEDKQSDSFELDEWVEVVYLWSLKGNIEVTAEVLKRELALIGISTVAELANAPIKKIEGAVRAALKSDAQALLSAAYQVGGN